MVKENLYLATIMQLAQQLYNQSIFMDIDTGQLLRYDPESEAYYPIIENGNAPTPIWHFDKSRLLDASQILTENIKDFQTTIRNNSAENQQYTQTQNSNAADDIQSELGKITETRQERTRKRLEQEKQQLFRYYSIAPFHQLYTDPIRSIALSIEQQVFELLQNTSKKDTIEKILKQYKLAQELAQKGDEYHLRQVEQKLQGKRRQQENMKRTREKLERQKRFLRTAKIIAATLFLVIIFAGIISHNIKKHLQRKNLSIAQTAQTTEKLSSTPSVPPANYYIIIGSYSQKKNAEKTLAAHPGVLLYDAHKRLWRVAVDSAYTLTQAKQKLSQYPKSWILKR